MLVTVQAARPPQSGNTALAPESTAGTAHSRYPLPPPPPGHTLLRQLYVEMSCGQLSITFVLRVGVLQTLVYKSWYTT